MTTPTYDVTGYKDSKAFESLCNFAEMIFSRNLGAVFEVRILSEQHGTFSGYFDDAEKMVRAILPFADSPRPKIPFAEYPRITEGNFYITMNPVDPTLLARSANQFRRAKKGGATSDGDVIAFNLLFFDFDPKRKSGISATDSERLEAKQVMLKVKDYLGQRGYHGITASSGNGYHLLFPLKACIGDQIAAAAHRGTTILKFIKKCFETEKCEIDTSVCTPAHLIKLYGSLAMKGSSTTERPHRFATIDIPDPLPQDIDIFSMLKDELDTQSDPTPVSSGTLPAIPVQSAIAADATFQEILPAISAVDKSAAQLEAFLDFKQLDFRRVDKEDLIIYELRDCPYHTGHDGHHYECCLAVGLHPLELSDGTTVPEGRWGANCKHDEDAGWEEFKEALGFREYAKTHKETFLGAGGTSDDGDGTTDDDDESHFTHLQITDMYLESIAPQRIVFRMGVFYQWDGYRYQEVPLENMNGLVMRFIQSNNDLVSDKKAKSATVREVVANLKGRSFIPDVDLNSFISGGLPCGDYIAVQNGILSLDRAIGEIPGDPLLSATPDYFSLVCLPYAYDPAATCPLWVRFLDEVVPDAAVQMFLQEWFGYNLTTRLLYEIFVILEGMGANGKSVILKILRALLGPENVATVPIELFDKPFNRYELYGKLANIVTEMGEADKVAEEIIKAIVSGDPIQFERKHKDPFSAPATAKLTFATNVLPPIRDNSNAIWRRLVLIPFLISIPWEKQDKGLGERLVTTELPGILNWATVGLKRLKARGRFEVPSTCKSASEEYQLESNSVRRFIDQECTVDANAMISTKALYASYTQFCHSTGAKPVGEVKFGKDLRKICPKVIRKSKGTGRGYAYEGISHEPLSDVKRFLEKHGLT